ncbi:MAG TPA: biotin transporter BioY [Firmicutes bacterium]|nr:biotin transporter BioY [Bacillota bacterium]
MRQHDGQHDAVYSDIHSARSIILAGLFGALTAVGAVVTIPLPWTPVPFSLQVLFVLLSGIVLGGKLGAMSQAIYIILGVIGLPVFSGGHAGPGVLVGPTGGYLLGFVVAPLVVSMVAGRGRREGTWSGLKDFAGTLLGVVVIYIFGASQLALVANLTPSRAISLGVLPFIAGDVVKAFLATWLARHLRRRGLVL